jgi:hypothetical protein
MIQVFRDCYSAEAMNTKVFGTLRLWLRTLLDLVQTAPKEHLENLRKEDFMNNLRRDAIAFIGCVAIIVLAFSLLTYGRKHEVAPILIFGYALDALVTTGVLGNLIVFLLVKVTKANPLRIALWTFLVVNAVPAVLLAFIGGRLSPQFRVGATLVGYALSFAFWYGVHWLWAQSKGTRQLAVSK